jgi:hypothetical protein
MGAMDAIFLSLLYYSKKANVMMISGAVIAMLSVIGIIYLDKKPVKNGYILLCV